jgi:hypothetical protein
VRTACRDEGCWLWASILPYTAPTPCPSEPRRRDLRWKSCFTIHMHTHIAAPALAALPPTLTPQEQASLGADARRCVRCKTTCQCEGRVPNHVPHITLHRHRCWYCCCCCGRLRRRVGCSNSTHARHTTTPAFATGANASQSLSRGGGWTQEINDNTQCRHANVLRTNRYGQGVAVVRAAWTKNKTIRPVMPTSLAIPWRCQMAAGSGVWPQDTMNPSHHTPPPGRGSAKPQRCRGLVPPPARVDQNRVRPGEGQGLQQGCRRPPLHHQPRLQACGAHLCRQKTTDGARVHARAGRAMETESKRKREATQSLNAR